MGKQLQVFTSNQFGQIRTIENDGQPWFVAADVCAALELANPTVTVSRLDKDEKAKFNLGLSGGPSWCINEPGLYSLVLACRKPQARAFKRWITHEVLPAIRKHGLYAISDFAENPEMLLAALQALIAEKKRGAQLEAQNLAQAQLLLEASPKLSYYEKVLLAPGAVAISKIAKDYGMSARRLNKLLHDLGIQYKQGDQWLLYQEHAANGYTKSETGTSKDGHVWMHTKWTQAGRLFIYNLLKNRCGILPVIEREGQVEA
ncbi:phage antirepressor [Mobiluncus mulieris]|uniref:phage antirepressor n=1 Tax=Mobiluncus mulieris TaxID=2052 RepID=UPI002432A023|nr:phage antirepressor KilAC domain-containing protein [Mobiluncus mulieris]